jgi:hypothetical protein
MEQLYKCCPACFHRFIVLSVFAVQTDRDMHIVFCRERHDIMGAKHNLDANG